MSRKRSSCPGVVLAAFRALGLTVWYIEPEDAGDVGEIRLALEGADTPIGPYDEVIAAQARRRSALPVTADTGAFARVPGPRAENRAVD